AQIMYFPAIEKPPITQGSQADLPLFKGQHAGRAVGGNEACGPLGPETAFRDRRRLDEFIGSCRQPGCAAQPSAPETKLPTPRSNLATLPRRALHWRFPPDRMRVIASVEDGEVSTRIPESASRSRNRREVLGRRTPITPLETWRQCH